MSDTIDSYRSALTEARTAAERSIETNEVDGICRTVIKAIDTNFYNIMEQNGHRRQEAWRSINVDTVVDQTMSGYSSVNGQKETSVLLRNVAFAQAQFTIQDRLTFARISIDGYDG